MKLDRRALIAVLFPGAVLLVWTALAFGLLVATLERGERATLLALVEPRAALVIMLALLVAGALGFLGRYLVRERVEAPARLLEDAQVLLASDETRTVEARGSLENRELARLISALALQRGQLRAEIHVRVQEASLAGQWVPTTI